MSHIQKSDGTTIEVRFMYDLVQNARKSDIFRTLVGISGKKFQVVEGRGFNFKKINT